MTNTKIGDFIASLRKEQGLTQEQLAEKVGVSNRSVSRWENGRTLPDFSLLQMLAEILNVSLAELLAGQRLPDDPNSRTEDCVHMALELAKREQDVLRKSLNRCFGFGLALILCASLFHNHTEAPLFFFLLCSGFGIALIIAGFLINNRKAAAITPSVLAAGGASLCMKTANELLHFSMKYQTGHKKPHRKAFQALSAALEDDECAQFSLIADSCTIDGCPGPWHIAIAVTNKRLLLSGETMRGMMLPVYPVKAYALDSIRGADLQGCKLILHLQSTVIQLDGSGFHSIIDGLQSFTRP